MEEIKELYNVYYDELDEHDVHKYYIAYDYMYDNNSLFKCIADNFIKERADLISSDREAAAFCKAMEVEGQYGLAFDFLRSHAPQWLELELSHDEFWKIIKEIENIEEDFNNKNLLSEEKERG